MAGVSVTEPRERAEQDLAREISRLSQAQLDELMRALGNPPNLANVPAAFWTRYAEEMQSAILPALQKIYLDSAQEMLDDTPAIGVDWTLVNASAAQWARQYSFDLVKGITDTTRSALQEKVQAYFETPGTISDLADSLSSLFGPVRAEMIAATETTRAAVSGQAAVVDELNKQGTQMIPYFITSEDEIVCEICSPLNGKRVSEGEFPPLHPRCRCEIAYKFD